VFQLPTELECAQEQEVERCCGTSTLRCSKVPSVDLSLFRPLQTTTTSTKLTDKPTTPSAPLHTRSSPPKASVAAAVHAPSPLPMPAVERRLVVQAHHPHRPEVRSSVVMLVRLANITYSQQRRRLPLLPAALARALAQQSTGSAVVRDSVGRLAVRPGVRARRRTSIIHNVCRSKRWASLERDCMLEIKVSCAYPGDSKMRSTPHGSTNQ